MRNRRCRMQAVHAVVAAACFSGLVGAADEVPFKARVSGTSTFDESGFEDFHGLGHATHMGRSSVHMQHTVTQAIEVLDGQFTLTAANGDVVCGSYSGQGIPESLDPFLIRFTGTFTIEGGTGRFAGATGGGEITGLVDPFPDEGAPMGTEADLTFDGTISRPSAGPEDSDDTCPAILTR